MAGQRLRRYRGQRRRASESNQGSNASILTAQISSQDSGPVRHYHKKFIIVDAIQDVWS